MSGYNLVRLGPNKLAKFPKLMKLVNGSKLDEQQFWEKNDTGALRQKILVIWRSNKEIRSIDILSGGFCAVMPV